MDGRILDAILLEYQNSDEGMNCVCFVQESFLLVRSAQRQCLSHVSVMVVTTNSTMQIMIYCSRLNIRNRVKLLHRENGCG